MSSHDRTPGQVPNPAFHEVCQEVDLHPLLQQIRDLGGSVDTVEDSTVDARVTAKELR